MDSLVNCQHGINTYVTENSPRVRTLDEEKNGYVARDQLLYAL